VNLLQQNHLQGDFKIFKSRPHPIRMWLKESAVWPGVKNGSKCPQVLVRPSQGWGRLGCASWKHFSPLYTRAWLQGVLREGGRQKQEKGDGKEKAGSRGVGGYAPGPIYLTLLDEDPSSRVRSEFTSWFCSAPAVCASTNHYLSVSSASEDAAGS
jgi:hypothetical protein